MVKKLIHLLGRVDARVQTRFIIILIVFTAAFTLAGAVWLVILIKPDILPSQAAAEKKDCAACHTDIYAGWHKGAHGDTKSKTAMSQGSNCLACHKETPALTTNVNNPISSFSDFWVKQGMPNDCPACHVTGYDKSTFTWKSDGIACETCHGVIPDNHPDAAVAVDKAKESCNICHTSDRFDWDKWKESVHFQNSLTCVDCHNPHTTSLKTIADSNVGNSSVCENCHKDVAANSEHSIHAKVSVTCIDCHLGDPKGNDDFHQMPDHDFKPKIETCNKCHAGQMHAAGDDKTITPPVFFRIKTGILNKDIAAPTKTFAEVLPNSARFILVAMVFGVVGGVSLRKSIFRKRK